MEDKTERYAKNFIDISNKVFSMYIEQLSEDHPELAAQAVMMVSLSKVFEVGISLGMRRPDSAREIISKLEEVVTHHDHPIDDYCISGDLLNNVITDLVDHDPVDKV